jgi:hypothetical protein
MMAAIIFVLSVVILLQFFVAYCRSLIAASARLPLSDEVQDVSGISADASGEDFTRVMQLLHLCPECLEDRGGLRAIGTYYRLLDFLRRTIVKLIPSLSGWTERERGHCTYFAAVALERRIAFSRDMLAQQMDS